ncbi:MAG: hypothetical protein ABI609_11770 [Acidobacteriota bacterium]
MAMSSVSRAGEASAPKRHWLGIIAISLLAYALCDLLHEAAHAVATLLPLGVRALSISTVAVATTRSSPVVAAAGSIANLALGLTIALCFSAGVRSSWRYFWWLFGSLNLFNATGYLLYSSVLDSGDMAVVFRALAPAHAWRPVVGLVGLAAYAGAVYVSLLGLRRLVATGTIAASRVERYCMLPYWSGGLLLTAGAALNPQSPWLVLTSGAAVGFGAMVGLVLVPRLLGSRARADHEPGRALEALDVGWPWVLSGVVAAIVFIAVFGPGIGLAGG